MKKRILIIIAIGLILALFPLVSVSAETGICGDNLTWELNNGVLVISGKGAMSDYELYDNGTRAPWGSGIRTVRVENGVTSIGRFAFAESELVNISLPQSINTIGWGAFADCLHLTDVAIPNSVKRIDGAAFTGCTNLESIVIPNGVTRIEKITFWGCGFKKITIPPNVTFIGEGAFIECEKLQSITLPSKVKTIDECAFAFCTSLQTLHIPNSVRTIGVSVCSCCKNLKDIYYGGIKEEFEAINIGEDNAELLNAKWHYAEPSNLTIKGLNYKLNHKSREAAFSGAAKKSITSIKIPDTIKVNGKSYKVTEIATNACKNLKNLTSVVIGKSIAKIGKNAFSGCKKLKKIEIKTTKLTAKKIGSNAFKTGCKKGTVKCPKNKVDQYAAMLQKKGLPKGMKCKK